MEYQTFWRGNTSTQSGSIFYCYVSLPECIEIPPPPIFHSEFSTGLFRFNGFGFDTFFKSSGKTPGLPKKGGNLTHPKGAGRMTLVHWSLGGAWKNRAGRPSCWLNSLHVFHGRNMNYYPPKKLTAKAPENAETFQNEGLVFFKMSFPFKGVIFRFQPLVFRGVSNDVSLDIHGHLLRWLVWLDP